MTPVKFKVAVVALLYTPPFTTGFQDPPLSVLNSQVYDKPAPVATTVKLAFVPTHADAAAGFVVMAAPEETVNTAAVRVDGQAPLETCAKYV